MLRKFLPLAIAAAFFTPALAHAANDSVWYTQPNQSGGKIELLEGACPASLAAGMAPGLHLARSNTLNSADLWGCWTAEGAGVVRIYWRFSGGTESFSYSSDSFTATPYLIAMFAAASEQAAKPNPYADLDAEAALRQSNAQKHKRARQPAAPTSSNAL